MDIHRNIYRFLRNIFEESINDPEKKAQIFLNRFDFEIGKYKVYFVFYEKLKPYQKLLNERLHISFEDDGCFKQIKRKQKSFIGVMETKAYDNYSAMKRAYSALEIFLRYLEVFLNDNISVIGKNGLVIRQDTQEGIILPVKAFGYKSIKPEPRENFKTEIDTIVLGCQEKGIYVIKYITYMSKEKIAKNYGIFPKSIVKELNGIFIAYIGLEMLLFMQGKAINEYKC